MCLSQNKLVLKDSHHSFLKVNKPSSTKLCAKNSLANWPLLEGRLRHLPAVGPCSIRPANWRHAFRAETSPRVRPPTASAMHHVPLALPQHQ